MQYNPRRNMRDILVTKISTIPVLMWLVFCVLYFYGIFYFDFVATNLVISVIFLSFFTDWVIFLLHVGRKYAKYDDVSFDPTKLTIVIACQNGADVIGNTIKGALVHVPPHQIIVVSDKSTDSTVEVAQGYGVHVIENTVNLQKGLSVSKAMAYVKTEYVLVLDDDTSIKDTFLPTSLLDEGYAAVAFNVMPQPVAGNLLNKLQTFEYRKSMMIGKSLRSTAGAVANVSGAIGLYHTADLVEQSSRHSGQYGGEDQQRTLFAHLLSDKKGIVFYDSPVFTKTPNTLRKWLKQRALRWNSSTQELFWLSLRIIFSFKTHYLLKMNRAYYVFILLTEPLRMGLILIGLLTFSFQEIAIIYLFYLLLDTLIYIKLGGYDPFWVVFFFPLYAKLNMLCRQVAHFFWFAKKYEYFFKKKWHIHVTNRMLLAEYGLVTVVLLVIWPLSIGVMLHLYQTLNPV